MMTAQQFNYSDLPKAIQDKLEKREFIIELIRKGVTNRDIVFATKQKFGLGVSHDSIAKYKAELKDQNGITNRFRPDPDLISKLKKELAASESKAGETEELGAQLLTLFMDFNKILRETGKILKADFIGAVKARLDTQLVNKYKELVKQ